MTEITKYIADDGKEFEDEDECLDYERGIKILKVYGFRAYDRQGKEIFPKDYVRNMDDFNYDACYIKVENIRGWEEFENFALMSSKLVSMTAWIIFRKMVFIIKMMITTVGQVGITSTRNSETFAEKWIIKGKEISPYPLTKSKKYDIISISNRKGTDKNDS